MVSSNPWRHQGKVVYMQVIFICIVLEFNGESAFGGHPDQNNSKF
jgi:hypothetical protein